MHFIYLSGHLFVQAFWEEYRYLLLLLLGLVNFRIFATGINAFFKSAFNDIK